LKGGAEDFWFKQQVFLFQSFMDSTIRGLLGVHTVLTLSASTAIEQDLRRDQPPTSPRLDSHESTGRLRGGECRDTHNGGDLMTTRETQAGTVSNKVKVHGKRVLSCLRGGMVLAALCIAMWPGGQRHRLPEKAP
jgi:hypothetical protein